MWVLAAGCQWWIGPLFQLKIAGCQWFFYHLKATGFSIPFILIYEGSTSFLQQLQLNIYY